MKDGTNGDLASTGGRKSTGSGTPPLSPRRASGNYRSSSSLASLSEDEVSVQSVGPMSSMSMSTMSSIRSRRRALRKQRSRQRPTGITARKKQCKNQVKHIRNNTDRERVGTKAIPDRSKDFISHDHHNHHNHYKNNNRTQKKNFTNSANSFTDVVDENLVMPLVENLGCFTPEQVRAAMKKYDGAADRAADWLFSNMDDLDGAIAALQSSEISAPQDITTASYMVSPPRPPPHHPHYTTTTTTTTITTTNNNKVGNIVAMTMGEEIQRQPIYCTDRQHKSEYQTLGALNHKPLPRHPYSCYNDSGDERQGKRNIYFQEQTSNEVITNYKDAEQEKIMKMLVPMNANSLGRTDNVWQGQRQSSFQNNASVTSKPSYQISDFAEDADNTFDGESINRSYSSGDEYSSVDESKILDHPAKVVLSLLLPNNSSSQGLFGLLSFPYWNMYDIDRADTHLFCSDFVAALQSSEISVPQGDVVDEIAVKSQVDNFGSVDCASVTTICNCSTDEEAEILNHPDPWLLNDRIPCGMFDQVKNQSLDDFTLEATGVLPLLLPNNSSSQCIFDFFAEPPSAESLNHTLKVVFLGGRGSDTPSNSLRMDSQSQHHSRQTMRSVKPLKPGFSLSVKSWCPDGHTNLSFSLWEMEGLAKDSHHATQSICFSPDSLYIIVYQFPTTTPTSSHYTNNGIGGNPDDEFNLNIALEEAHQKSQDELHRHMDEHFFSWVDLLSQRAPEGCAILPVVSFDEEPTNGVSDNDDDDKRIRDCCDLLKKRILEERDWKADIGVDHLDMDGNGSRSIRSLSSLSSSSSSLKIVFYCDNIPVIFPSRSDGSMELRHVLYNLGSLNSIFHHQLHKEITPLVSCLRKIVSSYRKEKYYVLPLDKLHNEIVDVFPEITHGEIMDALKFLSSVGDIIYFTKEGDGSRGTANQSVLSKFVILEPRWMAAVVSCILRDDWKVIRKNLNDTTTHNRRDSNVSILDSCIRSDKFSCPILSPQDATKIWGQSSLIKKTRDKISKLGLDDHLLLFIRQACEHCGIFVPFPIDEAASSLATMSDSSAVRYLLPGLCQEDPEHIENIWNFKSKEAWKTNLCQSWLLNDRIPFGMFDQVKITSLEELGGIVDGNQHTTDTNNRTTKISVSQLLCYKTALYVKLIEKKEDIISIVEFFIHLVRSDSLQCPASHTLNRGMKLVVSAKGDDAHDCDIIWRLGYQNIIDSIESVVKKALGVEVEREVSCPECMANSDPCEANVWKVDDNSFYEQTDPTICCNFGHRVSTKMIYGSRDDDTDATTVCTVCSCISASTASTYFREGNPGKSTEELLGAVVLVGLWDTNNECIVNVGTGFVADSSAGLIMTAGHIFYDLKQGSKVGPKYKGYKNAKAVIGTIHKSKKGVEAFFTYSAVIMTHDITNADAVVLRITSKFKSPMQCPSYILKQQPEEPIHHGEFKHEKTERLKLMKSRIDEQIRIIGFVQRGDGIYEQGQIINHTLSVAKGYVCNIKDSVSPIVQYGPEIFSPRSEVVIECTSYPGQSGGPCVNQDGKVIGIVSRNSHSDQRRCYLVPTSELEEILKRVKRRMPSDATSQSDSKHIRL